MSIIEKIVNRIRNMKQKYSSHFNVDVADLYESSIDNSTKQMEIATIDVENSDGEYEKYSIISEEPSDFDKTPESILENLDSKTWKEIIEDLEKSIAEDRKRMGDCTNGTV